MCHIIDHQGENTNKKHREDSAGEKERQKIYKLVQIKLKDYQPKHAFCPA